jgi:isopenicillin N synthase-like dioxygenase
MAVPTLDFSKFISGTPEERKQFALDLLDSFERTGFAKLKNHTFSNDQLRELFHWVSNFLQSSDTSSVRIVLTKLFKTPRDTRSLTSPWRSRTRFQTSPGLGPCVATLLGE